MADVHFSWSDSFQAAFSSCLPCLKPSSSADAPSDTDEPTPRPRPHNAFAHAIPPPRAHPDELQGLLADSDDADALSLHTNPGDRTRRKKRRRAPKHIRVFGFDIFGRPPAIQLPDSDDEDASRRSGGGRDRPRTISSSSMDSDAAPLDPSAIEQMSAARNVEALAKEDEERRAKEERRRRRRERKELKRAAMAMALNQQTSGEQDFEGFQGSGPVFGHAPPSPFAPSLTSGTGSGSMSVTSSQEFGPFAHGQPVQNFDPDAAEAARQAAEAEADGADFGAESYTSRPRKSKSKSSGGSGTMTTSDTRSSSSRGTGSNGYSFVPGAAGNTGTGPAPYNHQYFAHQPFSPSPLSPGADSIPSSPMESTPTEKRKRRKSKSKAQSLSISHSNSSQSATASSVMSPPPSAHTSMPTIVSPGAGGDDFEGFPGNFGSSDLRAVQAGGQMIDMHDPDTDVLEHEQPKKVDYLPVTGFPSAGLRGIERRNSDMGVFLARRGDE